MPVEPVEKEGNESYKAAKIKSTALKNVSLREFTLYDSLLFIKFVTEIAVIAILILCVSRCGAGRQQDALPEKAVLMRYWLLRLTFFTGFQYVVTMCRRQNVSAMLAEQKSEKTGNCRRYRLKEQKRPVKPALNAV
ncbi:hypothetical protein J3D56_000820 [Erwinia persicina]|uniref:hypothetical protein n=1 Tax=Erwinia persicina TaxID=55211 RepID=UPI00209FCB2D|nr:hypothetical protein [Erwinia persicina]MCP1437384.1 hypothetical protein [Erwinia persicina]